MANLNQPRSRGSPAEHYSAAIGAVLTILFINSMVILQSLGANSRLNEVFNWKQVNFQYSSADTRKQALEHSKFVPSNNLIHGLERWQDKLFLTIPRIKPGVPATLTYVSLNDTKSKSPDLIPYPSWQVNCPLMKTNEKKLNSVYRVKADACNRLWVMDNGMVDNMGKRDAATPPTILVYDLKADKLIRSYALKEKEDYMPNSLFPNIVVDVTSTNCENAFAYVPDVHTYGLVVYGWKSNQSHRIMHNYFHFDPLSGDFAMSNGKNFQWQDGVFGIALSPENRDGFRTVYFHPLASTMEFSVSSKVLQNLTLNSEALKAFKALGNRGPNTQSTASSLDEETGVLFYTQIKRNAVACWNSFKGDEYAMKSQGVIVEDSEILDYPNDIKADRTGTLWVLTDKLPDFLYGSLDEKAINMRVLSAPIRQAIKGTVCDEM